MEFWLQIRQSFQKNGEKIPRNMLRYENQMEEKRQKNEDVKK